MRVGKVLIFVGVLAAAVIGLILGSVAVDRLSHRKDSTELYITSLTAPLTQPTGYAGVLMTFDYFYKKDEARVRAVVSVGAYSFDDSVVNNIDALFSAVGIFPSWACFLNDASTADQSIASFTPTGGLFTNVDNQVIALMYLTNRVAYQGTWELFANPSSGTYVSDTSVYLGLNSCVANYNSTHCLGDIMGEIIISVAHLPIDRAAWDAHWTTAAVGI